MYWNFSGKLLSANTNMNFNSQFKNRWRLNGNFNRQSQSVSTTLLRGGPSFINPGTQSFNLNVGSDYSKKLSIFFGNYHGSGDSKSFSGHEYYAEINYRPTNSLSVSLEPSYGIENRELQYVTAAGTDQNPVYLFAKLYQKTIGMTFRLNYTINPELSIEYYGQPFISAGKYTNYKKITEVNADRFRDRFYSFAQDELSFDSESNSFIVDENKDGITDYTISNPDFNFRQFRSNLVVRWEYLPGSTIYLVWSQGRTSSGTNGLFSYGNDMKNLFKVTPHNVFLVKFSYWFAL
jgi:hypothetical protein